MVTVELGQEAQAPTILSHTMPVSRSNPWNSTSPPARQELTEVNTRRVACRRQVLQRRARCRTYRRRVHTGVFYRPAAPQWRAQSRCSRPALLWVSGRRCPRQWQPTAGAASRRHRVRCSGVGTTGEGAVVEVVSRAEVCEPAHATHLACEKEVLNDAAQLRLQVVPKLVRSF